jgi:hypothetical protein
MFSVVFDAESDEIARNAALRHPAAPPADRRFPIGLCSPFVLVHQKSNRAGAADAGFGD